MELGSMGFPDYDKTSKTSKTYSDSDWEHIKNNPQNKASVFKVYFPISHHQYTINKKGFRKDDKISK